MKRVVGAIALVGAVLAVLTSSVVLFKFATGAPDLQTYREQKALGGNGQSALEPSQATQAALPVPPLLSSSSFASGVATGYASALTVFTSNFPPYSNPTQSKFSYYPGLLLGALLFCASCALVGGATWMLFEEPGWVKEKFGWPRIVSKAALSFGIGVSYFGVVWIPALCLCFSVDYISLRLLQ